MERITLLFALVVVLAGCGNTSSLTSSGTFQTFSDGSVTIDGRTYWHDGNEISVDGVSRQNQLSKLAGSTETSTSLSAEYIPGVGIRVSWEEVLGTEDVQLSLFVFRSPFGERAKFDVRSINLSEGSWVDSVAIKPGEYGYTILNEGFFYSTKHLTIDDGTSLVTLRVSVTCDDEAQEGVIVVCVSSDNRREEFARGESDISGAATLQFQVRNRDIQDGTFGPCTIEVWCNDTLVGIEEATTLQTYGENSFTFEILREQLFKDIRLERAVRNALVKEDEALFTEDDFTSLRRLDASGLGILFLEGIERFIGLEWANFSGSSVEDIYPLQHCSSLSYLDISHPVKRIGIDSIMLMLDLPLRHLNMHRVNMSGSAESPSVLDLLRKLQEHETLEIFVDYDGKSNVLKK